MRMNLARHYDALKPLERIAVINAAWMRGDDAEAAALQSAAPQATYNVPEHFWVGAALRQVELIYLVGQLDRCALFWQWLAFDGKDALHDPSDPMHAVCYRLVADHDGWALFCEGLGFPAPGIMGQTGEYDMLERTLPLARLTAFTQVEMVNWLEANGATAAGITPDDRAAFWRAALDQLA